MRLEERFKEMLNSLAFIDARKTAERGEPLTPDQVVALREVIRWVGNGH